MKKQKYFLGIDWGKSKTGLALADDENRIAVPFKEVETKKLINEIEKLSSDYFFEKIIFGDNGVISKIKEVEQIKKMGFSIIFENEDFSTLMAQQNIQEFRKKNITKKDNAESARIILQSWLDRR